jgi:hypothetical protein
LFGGHGGGMVTEPQSRDYARFVSSALIIAAFGPLLIPSAGFRTDHLLVYGLLPVAFGLLCVGRRPILFQGLTLAILAIFVFITLWTLIVTLGGVPSNVGPTDRTRMDEFKGLENYFQMIAVMMVMGGFVVATNSARIEKILDRAGSLLVVLIFLNSIIALASIFVDTLPITRYFVQVNTGDDESLYEALAKVGRLTGIFQYPSAAGIANSLGLLLWTYFIRRRQRVSFWSYIVGAVIIVGGAISISKSFLFGGLPLFVVYWLLPGRYSPRFTLKLAFLLAAAIAALVLFVESWTGLDRFMNILEGGGRYDNIGLLIHFVQIRYGFDDQGNVTGLFPYIWSEAPVMGLGFAYLDVTDSAYLQYFMQGGLVAVLLYFGFILLILFFGVIEWYRGRELGRFMTVLGLFVLLGGIGTPVLTVSRVNVMLWVVLMLVLALRQALRSDEAARTGAQTHLPATDGSFAHQS